MSLAANDGGYGRVEVMHARWRRINGFTLVEMLTVMILLSILAVVAMARLDLSPFQTASFDQELRSAIRFAQKFAIVSGCDVQVQVDAAADSYALYIRDDVAAPADCLSAGSAFGTPLTRPGGGGAAAGAAPGNVDVTSGLTFSYDRRGRPSSGGTIDVDGRTITVEPVTGYVY